MFSKFKLNYNFFFNLILFKTFKFFNQELYSLFLLKFMSGTKNFYFHLNVAVNLISVDEIADDLKAHLSSFHLKNQKKNDKNKHKIVNSNNNCFKLLHHLNKIKVHSSKFKQQYAIEEEKFLNDYT